LLPNDSDIAHNNDVSRSSLDPDSALMSDKSDSFACSSSSSVASNKDQLMVRLTSNKFL
jgi:hypothetical protein